METKDTKKVEAESKPVAGFSDLHGTEISPAEEPSCGNETSPDEQTHGDIAQSSGTDETDVDSEDAANVKRTSRRKSTKRKNLAKEKRFLSLMRSHTKEAAKYDVRGNFKNLLETQERFKPKTVIVDLARTSINRVSQLESGTVIGTDLVEIELNQLHDEFKGQIPRHTMLLGDSGAGKSFMAKTYAMDVAEGRVEGMEDIELVHIVNASDLQNEMSTAFDLLFTQQVGGELEKDPDLQEAGRRWLQNNSHKSLFVVDGLDQCETEFGGKYPKIGASNNAKANVVLANVMSGKIWPRMNIVTTTRWLTYWRLHAAQKPSKTVALRGFDDQSMEGVIKSLVGEEPQQKILSHLKTRAPGLLSLCKNPMFLLYTVEVLQQKISDPPDNLSGIMAAVFRYFAGSENFDADMMSLMKLSWHGMRDNRFTFTESYIRNLGIDPSVLRGPVSVKAALLPYQSLATSSDVTYSFSHQSLQELLASLYLFNFDEKQFDGIVLNELILPKMEVVQKLLFGITLNSATTKLVENYVKDRPTSLAHCREKLLEQLKSFIHDGVLEDIKIVSLFHECGSDVINRFKSDIDRINISDTRLREAEEEYALASVISGCVPLQEVRIERLVPNPTILPILQHCCASVENFQLKLLYVQRDSNMKPDDFRELADCARKTRTQQLTIDSCDLNKSKLGAFGDEAEKSNLRISNLMLSQVAFRATKEEIDVLCALAGYVTNVLWLRGWILDQNKIDMLQKALNSSTSKMSEVWLDTDGEKIVLRKEHRSGSSNESEIKKLEEDRGAPSSASTSVQTPESSLMATDEQDLEREKCEEAEGGASATSALEQASAMDTTATNEQNLELQLSSGYERATDRDRSQLTEMTVPCQGGEITCGDCSIYFPNGSLAKPANVTLSLHDGSHHWPEGFDGAFSLVRCQPSDLQLTIPAKVKVRTWYTRVPGSNENMHVFTRRSEESHWQEIRRLDPYQREVEFECRHFSDFILLIRKDANLLGIWLHHLRPLVFYDDKGNVVFGVRTDDNGKLEVVQTKYKEKGYREAFVELSTIEASMKDQVSMAISCNNGINLQPSGVVDIEVTHGDIQRLKKCCMVPVMYEVPLIISFTLKIQERNVDDGACYIQLSQGKDHRQYRALTEDIDGKSQSMISEIPSLQETTLERPVQITTEQDAKSTTINLNVRVGGTHLEKSAVGRLLTDHARLTSTNYDEKTTVESNSSNGGSQTSRVMQSGYLRQQPSPAPGHHREAQQDRRPHRPHDDLASTVAIGTYITDNAQATMTHHGGQVNVASGCDVGRDQKVDARYHQEASEGEEIK